VFITATKLALVAVALLLLAPFVSTSADAQRIRPECMKFRDKVGCTCALDNGGIIQPRRGGTGWRWSSKIAKREAVNEAFVQCLRRQGRG
jgi:hypothetical protein